MGKLVKLLLILTMCVSLLALVGCGKEDPATDDYWETTAPVPEDTTGEDATTEATTTQQTVNLVEDPENNGEGDPTDAMGGTTDPKGEDGKPGIDVEIEDDGGNTGGNNGGSNTPTENEGGDNGGSTTTTKADDDDDDFSVDFGDLLG